MATPSAKGPICKETTATPSRSTPVQKSNIPANSGLATGFVSKLNSTGTALVYSTFLGGNILDEPFGITVDASGNAYIAGVTFSTTFPVTPGVIQSTNRSAAITGFNDFVTKLNPAGNAFVYSTYLGGSSENGSQLGSLYWENPVVVDKAVRGEDQPSDHVPVAVTLEV